jgi:hypothetical protein
VWKNKEGENGEVERNKSRLVAKGFSQNEGIDYEETFAPVARLEVITILLAFSVAKGFKLHQMDVKSAFLNGLLEEEVYVRQPPGFESEKYPHRVYKLRKALYGLKQAPRAWYGRLSGSCLREGLRWGRSIIPCVFSGRAEISGLGRCTWNILSLVARLNLLLHDLQRV